VASRFRYAAGGLLLMACLAGCVSMPNGGPVQSYPVTQGAGAQSQRYLQIIPDPPGAGWSPSEIVRGFLTASASFADRQNTAREYLTASFSHAWNPSWSATVFGGTGPYVGPAAFPSGGKRKQATATVTVTGTVQASLSGPGTYGIYAVPSAPSTAGGQPYSNSFDLVKVGGQWRISSAPDSLLLTSVEFKADYQLRNLYFFDASGRYLVPDPVYVPLQTTPSNLMNGLVEDLIHQPKDWLAHGATRTAFPAGTKLIGDVMLEGGTAAVNLGGAITRASDPVRQWVSAQLLSTLSGSSQGQPLVQSVTLSQNGKPWIPPDAQDNPVQHDRTYSAPDGASEQFYYLDGDGQLWRRADVAGAVGAPSRVARVGTGYSAIDVSRDGHYLAALRNGIVYTGPVGGPLARRTGTGYTTMSWDPNDNLWVAGSNGIVMLRANASPRSAAGAPVQVQVLASGGNPDPGPFTALSVAPDGVRVAVINGPSDLNFGAIVTQPPAHAGQQAQVKIRLSPFYVSGTSASFQSVTWYGPDNVITLAESASGPALAEYPVNGGSATRIPSQGNIVSITASHGSALIAGARKGLLLSDASISGSWVTIGNGLAPGYPG
jgi:lipoprotein LpqB-like beta-propeller protein/sporulation and spore germination protein